MDASDLLAQLSQLADEMGPGLEPPGATDQLRAIVEAVRELLNSAACSVAAVDEDEECLVFLAVSGEGADRVVGSRIPLSTGIAGWVVASGQSLTVSDTAQDSRFAADVASETGYVPKSLLAVPLQTDDDVLGVLEVLDAQVEPDGPSSRLLELHALQATLTLQTMITFDSLGVTLLRVLSQAAGGKDLKEALEDATRSGGRPQRELAQLADLFFALGRIGADERSAAIRLLTTFVSYAQQVTPQP